MQSKVLCGIELRSVQALLCEFFKNSFNLYLLTCLLLVAFSFLLLLVLICYLNQSLSLCGVVQLSFPSSESCELSFHWRFRRPPPSAKQPPFPRFSHILLLCNNNRGNVAEQQQSSAGIRDQKVSFSSQQSTQRVYILKISSLLKSNQMHSVQNQPKTVLF